MHNINSSEHRIYIIRQTERELGDMDHRQLRDNIRTFSLGDCARGNQGYNRVLLQLFGYTGHGKSSLINSCIYALEEDGGFIEHAEAGDQDGGKTMIRKAYELTGNITMVDNRGYNRMDGFQRAEVYAQLGNFIPVGEKVVWRDNYTDMMIEVERSDMDPNCTDFIVPVLVYSAKAGLAEGEKPEVKIFISNCIKMTGVAPIIVLTNKTSGDYFEIEKQFKLIGAETVIAVENYTNEDSMKTLRRTTDFLMFIDGSIKQVIFRMEQKRNPREERLQRKIFLLQYIHEAEMKKEEDKRERERRKEEEFRAKVLKSPLKFLFQLGRDT
ncbi:uncharacterized protein LOC134945670 [Pseudophryne corroboree]|uniref:uncharacterized protein LOC134945670 n=1 Tax=Pseudophryne corroboree TaxID=495146 RepID=UPI003081E128